MMREALDLVTGQSTLALATCDADGTLRVAPLFYLADEEFRLYWFSSARSAHSKNLKRDPQAAVAVYSPTDTWQEIRGVQMRGTARVVTGRALRREISARYMERFRLDETFAAPMAGSRLYCFEPLWIRYLDNSRGFGYRCTVKG
jgi:uncharacterized protein YhbP (UPF0306 family)